MKRLKDEFTKIKMIKGPDFYIDADLKEVKYAIAEQINSHAMNQSFFQIDIWTGVETRTVLINPDHILYIGVCQWPYGKITKKEDEC